MNRALKGIIIVTICFVLIVALGLTAILVLGINGRLPKTGLFGGFGGELPLANRQEYSVLDFDSLTVHYTSERITLMPAQGNQIVLEEYMSRWEEDMLANVSTQNGALNIQAGNRPIFGGFPGWRGYIIIYLPPSWSADILLQNSSGSIRCEHNFTFGSFAAKTTSGSIRLQGISAAEHISLKASSGGVSAEELRAGGTIDLATTSGGIRIEAATAGRIDAQASSGSVRFGQATTGLLTVKNSSGSIRVGRVQGEFNLANSSGGIHIESGEGHGQATNSSGGVDVSLQKLTGDIHLKTTSGSCKLFIPSTSAFEFYAQTTSGSIRTPDNDRLSYNQRGNQATGNFGDQPVYKVDMQASSGGVKLDWA